MPTIREEIGRPELQRMRRALVVVDVVESVRLMQADEATTIDRWRRFVHHVRQELLPRCGGRMVKSLGDGMLLEFDGVPPAVTASLQMHKLAAVDNRERHAASKMFLRMGVHVGDVVADELDLYGPAVNLAARLAALADPGGTVASAQARDELSPGLHAEVEDLGDCFVKHLEQPIRCFRLRALEWPAAAMHITTPGALDSLHPVVAVLPFRPRSGDQTNQVVGDAIADDLISALSRRRDWRVVSRLSTSAFRAPHVESTLEQIQRALKASFVVDGSYSVRAGQLRMQVELTNVRNGTVMWAGRTSLPLDSLFAGDDDALISVVYEIGKAIDGSELRRVGVMPLPTLESYSLYLSGTNLLNRLGQQDFNRSRDILQHVGDRVPRAASPHAMLAKWHVMRMTQGWTQDPKAEGLAARSCANRALQLEPHHAYALAVDGLVATQVDNDLELARRRYEAAIDADPQEPYAWAALSGLCAYQDDAVSAESAARRAIALSPLDPARFMYESYLAVALVHAEKFADAIEAAKRSLRFNRALTGTYRILAVAQVLAGQVNEARESVRTLLTLEPHQTLSSFQRRYPGRDSRHMPKFVDSLRIAGVPA